MNPLVRWIASWAAPVVVTAAYVGLILVIEPSLTIALFILIGLLVVLVLWFVFRELATHAAITRSIAVGEPDDVVTRARNAIDHRFTRRARLPFQIYEAIGLGLRGDWDKSLESAAAIDAGVAPGWRLLAAAARVAAATELADAAGARAALSEVTAVAQRVGWRADVLVKECQARVAFVEGDRAGAGPVFRALADDIRLGPAPRAAALLYAGRCEDDRDAARRDFTAAARLAPKTWVKTAAERELAAR